MTPDPTPGRRRFWRPSRHRHSQTRRPSTVASRNFAAPTRSLGWRIFRTYPALVPNQPPRLPTRTPRTAPSEPARRVWRYRCYYFRILFCFPQRSALWKTKRTHHAYPLFSRTARLDVRSTVYHQIQRLWRTTPSRSRRSGNPPPIPRPSNNSRFAQTRGRRGTLPRHVNTPRTRVASISEPQNQGTLCRLARTAAHPRTGHYRPQRRWSSRHRSPAREPDFRFHQLPHPFELDFL